MIGVRVQSSPHWKDFNRATLGVSLHSPNFENGALDAILDWANLNYRELVIDLTDTINRHPYQAEKNLSVAEACLQARQAGDKWLRVHQAAIDRLTIPHTVIRWDRWLNDDRFELYGSQFEDAYQGNTVFRAAVDRDIETYCQRRFGKTMSEIDPRLVDGSRRYILEEITCHSMMYEDRPAATLYPGKELECYKLVRSGACPELPNGLAQGTFVRLVLHGMTPKALPHPVLKVA